MPHQPKDILSMTITQLRNNVKHGDLEVIADMAGCSASYVYYILTGKRNSETILGRKIITAANKIITTRLKLQKELN